MAGMTAVELRKALNDWTLRNCGLEQRGYVGMSTIGKCPVEIYERVRGEWQWNGTMARYCYEGYLHERDMIARLTAMGIYRPGRELVADFDDRLRGHTDGETSDGNLIEIKSVSQSKFDEVLGTYRALQGHYEQVQLYMKFGGYHKAMVVYKCRESGKLFVLEVVENKVVQDRLVEKARRVLAALDAGVRPKCVCGKHDTDSVLSTAGTDTRMGVGR